jgi:hypothetical protein
LLADRVALRRSLSGSTRVRSEPPAGSTIESARGVGLRRAWSVERRTNRLLGEPIEEFAVLLDDLRNDLVPLLVLVERVLAEL